MTPSAKRQAVALVEEHVAIARACQIVRFARAA